MVTCSLVLVSIHLCSHNCICYVTQNVGLKLGDFVLQLALLSQSLENGYPLVLIYIFTGTIALNAVACVLMMCLERFQSGLLQVLLNCGYELFQFL